MKVIRLLTLTLGLALATSLMATSPAEADSSKTLGSGTITKSVSLQSYFTSSAIGRCLSATINGTMTASWSKIQMVPSYTNGYSSATYYTIYSPKFKDPKLSVAVYDKCGSDRKAKTLTQLKFRQSYYTTLCKANVSVGLSAGTGFSVGLSATPTCGRVTVAKRESFSQQVLTAYSQSNSGAVLTWPASDQVVTSPAAAKSLKACIRPFVYLDAAVGGNFDNQDLDFSETCISYPA